MADERANERQNEALKDAFARIKNDIFLLGDETYAIRTELLELKNQINAINESINSIKIDILEQKNQPHYPTHIPTDNPKKPAISAIPTDNPTHPLEIGGLNYPNFDISTRNGGVPTDKPTNQQTDNSLIKPPKKDIILLEKPLVKHINDASIILDSLDAIKKEIRLKFKQITSQEMLVFSTIYQLEELSPEGVEYRQIAQKLGLSESSIRDYAQKLISKGIPLDKIKLNNKKILLKISQKLKTIAPLDTLIRLREL